jgi:hypothetical protein
MFLGRYNNTLLSSGCVLVTLGLLRLFFVGYFSLSVSLYVAVFVLMLDILGIVFAVRSVRLNESSRAGTFLGIIAMLMFIFILYITAVTVPFYMASR